MAFIKLTSEEKTPIYINTDYILNFFGNNYGSYITQLQSSDPDPDDDTCDLQLFVLESPQIIAKKIREAEKE